MQCELEEVKTLTELLPCLKLGRNQQVLLEAFPHGVKFTALNNVRDVRVTLLLRAGVFRRYAFDLQGPLLTPAASSGAPAAPPPRHSLMLSLAQFTNALLLLGGKAALQLQVDSAQQKLRIEPTTKMEDHSPLQLALAGNWSV
eukprot:g14945.t1